MICYLCNVNVGDLQALVVHFKIIHLLKSDSAYTCLENDCSQSFNCLSSFKRHVNKKHIISDHVFQNIPTNNVDVEVSKKIKLSDDPSLDLEKPFHDELTDNFNFENSIKVLYESTVKFILSLYNNNNFNISDVHYIQSGVKENILKPMAYLLKNVVNKDITEPRLLSTFNRLETVILNPFIYCSTEYRLNKWLIDNKLLSNVQQININNELCAVNHGGEIYYNEKITKGTLLPLKLQFKQFFENSNNFKVMYDRILSLKASGNVLSNFVQGKLWEKKITQFEGKIVFPYFIYIDDFEINNPLGSHATYQSIAAIYYSFPLVENNSKLSNIFLAALIKSADLKEFGNDPCLLQLINEINFLEEEGLSISTEYGEFQVYFILGLVLGDNLGLISILEFSKSFSSNYYCRFCKTHKSIAQKLCVENILCMRNHINYSDDVAKMDFSETGINKNSILNSIKSFHVTENYCVDVMHDVFEGICHYNMCHIIKYYVYTAQIFSLDILNKRKTNFNYGPIEVGNISPEISENHLNKCHLKMSAREMMSFIHFFTIMVGDLIPKDDEVWKFFLTLLKLIDLLLSYNFTEGKIMDLKQLISQHNSMYIRLFNDTLKPKHHFLIHYPTIIQYSGPPRFYWCFKYEGKHRELKMYARTTTSRKNITLTLAKKCQYKFAHILLQSSVQEIIIKEKHKILSLNSDNICKILSLSSVDFCCYNQIEFMGTIYKKGYYLTKFIEEMSLFEIIEVIVFNIPNKRIHILAKQIKIINFNSHFEAFEVDCNKTVVKDCVIYNVDEFSGPPINITPSPSGKLMIRLKEFF